VLRADHHPVIHALVVAGCDPSPGRAAPRPPEGGRYERKNKKGSDQEPLIPELLGVGGKRSILDAAAAALY
jgi:hypothetical protein